MQNNNDDDLTDGQKDKQDKSRQKNDLQRNILMTEADLNKYNSEKIQLEAEIRVLKKEESRMKVDLQDKQSRLSKVDYELMQLDSSMKSLRKKMNLL